MALQQVRDAINALEQEDPDAAAAIGRADAAIDAGEIDLDADIVKLLARRQPVAADLRKVMATARSIADIERIGDEAAKVGELTLAMIKSDSPVASASLLRESRTLGAIATECLERALEAIADEDGGKAALIMQRQNDLDQEFQGGLRRLTTYVMEDQRNIGHLLHIVLINKSLERIGDHACNLAEHLIYQLRGADVRHGHA
jgi:phosphate transport system protein